MAKQNSRVLAAQIAEQNKKINLITELIPKATQDGLVNPMTMSELYDSGLPSLAEDLRFSGSVESLKVLKVHLDKELNYLDNLMGN